MAEQLCNRASAVLTAAINTSVTTIPVSGNTGFPATQNFRLRVDNELMLVTNGGTSSTSWTVVRGIEGTVAAGHPAGTRVTVVLTAAGIIQYLNENYVHL